MRPSELLRMFYAFDRDDTHDIYPCETCNINAIIAKACYMERLTAPKGRWQHEEYERTRVGLSVWKEMVFMTGRVPEYRPHQAIPWAWVVRIGGAWDKLMKKTDEELLRDVQASMRSVREATRDECIKFLMMDEIHKQLVAPK